MGMVFYHVTKLLKRKNVRIIGKLLLRHQWTTYRFHDHFPHNSPLPINFRSLFLPSQIVAQRSTALSSSTIFSLHDRLNYRSLKCNKFIWRHSFFCLPSKTFRHRSSKSLCKTRWMLSNCHANIRYISLRDKPPCLRSLSISLISIYHTSE